MSSEEIKYILSVKDDGTATINKVNSELSSLDDHAKKANTSFSSMTSIMSGLKTAIVGIGLYKLVGELKSLAQEAGAAQKSSAGLTQSMISNGRYSEQLHKKLIDTAKALQQVTTYEDDATIEGQKFLLMYSKISDNLLPRATEAMLDLAAMMGGDLSGAAKLLGKASEGVTSGLSRYGIVIDESTAKSGDFGKILDAVTEKVGGQARALATTGIGQWEQLNNLWGDARENLGDLVLELGEGFLPILRDVVTSINNLVEDKDKISDWATNFQIQLINVEAEVMRLAMLVDKAGGTLTSIGMGAAGITTWTESGKKAFETFAQMNIDLEKNYKKTDKALEELAIKQIALEKQLTSEYKAEMEKRRKAAEEVLEASSTGTKKGGISIADDSFAEALKKIDSVRESWSDTKRSLETDIKLSLFDDSNWGQYQKQLINSQLETDNLKDKNKDLYGSEKEAAYALINQAQAAKDAAAQIKYLSKTQEDLNSLSDKLAEQYLKVSDAYDKAAANLSKENKYTKQAKDAVKAYTDAQKYGIITYNEMIQKIDELNKHYQNLIDNELAEKQEDFYKDLLGYEDEYYEAALKNIEAKRQAEIEAIGDIEAANEKARQRMGELEHNMFTQKTGYISDGLSAMQSAFDEAGMSTQALVIAQKALAVVNAVNAITTQGLGDPYTAFARIAAMIAAMTSLLSSAGISFSGGGGGTASASLPKSTVLGAEAGTGSSSINNSYEMLKDTYSMEYSELSELNASMKALNSNISGLVSNILRYGVGNTESWDLSGLDKTSGIGGFIMDTWKTALTAGTGILPISDSINKLINKATNAVFGGSTSYKIKASGLALGGISVADLMGGEDVSAKAYARIKKTVEGGWFSSDKYSYSTKYASLSSSTTDLISSIYSDISTTLVALTTELGTDMSKTMAYAFKATKLNLKGMTSDEINDTLSEYFSNIGDKAVEKLFGSMLKGYQEVGEGLLETAVRLVQDKAIITDMLEKTNQKFTGSVKKMIAFSESLIDLAGDLDTLQEAFQSYYSAFISEKEQAADLKNDLSEVLRDLGKTLPSTRSGYKSLVESLNLTTASGKEAYVALLSYAEAADSYYSYLEEIAEEKTSLQIELLEAQGKSEEALALSRKAELAAMDPSLRALQKQIWATEDLADAMEDVTERSDIITDWFNSLITSDAVPVTSSESYTKQYNALLAAAGTSTEDLNTFLNFVKTYLDFMKGYTTDYAALYNAVLADVTKLKGSYGEGGTIPETGAYWMHKNETVISGGLDSNKIGQIIGSYVAGALSSSNQTIKIQIGSNDLMDIIVKRGATDKSFQTMIQKIAGSN